MAEKQKYHIGKNGPAPCNATKRACRYGGDVHYDSMEEADTAYQKQRESSTGDDAMTKKSSDPYAADRVRLQSLDPVGVDTEAAVEYGKLSELRYQRDVIESRLGRWKEEMPKHSVGGYYHNQLSKQIAESEDKLSKILPMIDEQAKKNAIYGDEFQRRGGWSRAFLVVNNNGHVHSSMDCSTCFDTTKYQWMTAYSGKSEDEIVGDAGERACTVCYPSAETSGSLNKPTKMFTDDEVQAQKDREERARKRAEKEQKAKEKGIFGPDGEPLRIVPPGEKYGTTYNAEVTARTELVDRLRSIVSFDNMDKMGMAYNPKARDRDNYIIKEISEAIARKHGVTPEAVLKEADAKMRKKFKKQFEYDKQILAEYGVFED